MGNMLDAPKTDKLGSELRECAGLKVGMTGMQGWRLEMEDSHLCMELPSKRDHVIVGVFDGHGGAGSALWVEKNLVPHLEHTPEWEQYVRGEVENPTLVGQALTKAFLSADAALLQFQNDGGPGADKSGCTSVVCVVTPQYIVCANAGDSRCILATKDSVKPMSFDHKPYDEPELRRIEAAGGHVSMKRVDGDLAVSRALGDFQFKDNTEKNAIEQKVSPEPDIIIHQRCASDEFLLLACDGLWDVMSNEDASDFGRSLFKLGESDMMLFAEEMIDAGLEKGSRDNISAVVMKLEGASISGGSGVTGLREERARKAAEEAAKRELSAASGGPR